MREVFGGRIMALVYDGHYYKMFCNGCEKRLELIHYDANVMGNAALDQDWKRILGFDLDYCPECNKEYEKQRIVVDQKKVKKQNETDSIRRCRHLPDK